MKSEIRVLDKLNVLFDGLKSQTDELISAVQQSCSDERINDMAIGLLLKVVETEQRCKQLYASADMGELSGQGSPTEVRREISKVRKKLENWVRPEKQHQKNVKILNTFLDLEAQGRAVTVDMMRHAYGNDPEFLRNYPQMKNISPKNHGKVFEEDGSVVRLWEPIKEYVEDYRKKRAV